MHTLLMRGDIALPCNTLMMPTYFEKNEKKSSIIFIGGSTFCQTKKSSIVLLFQLFFQMTFLEKKEKTTNRITV